MNFKLTDIMDLDYLLALDEQETSPKKTEEIAARDRDIFKQVKPTDGPGLLMAWLEYRKLLFGHETNHSRSLPGPLFASLYLWMTRAVLLGGGMAGFLLSWSFLVYHGMQPVNVTLFLFLFVAIPLVFSVATLVVLVARQYAPRSGDREPGFFHALMSSLLMKGLPKALKKLGWPGADKAVESVEYAAALARTRRREYRDLFFWPVFLLSSWLAVSFSAGVLGGTLFRVATTDVAFGWQSTLAAGPGIVHDLVALVSAPWSWWAPDFLAPPTEAEIQGSRIILKQGIAGLSTTHLTAWWPFLCLGIVFYALLPRLALILAGNRARKKALEAFDLDRPRFRRLIIRMKSPVMDIRFKERPVTRPAPAIVPKVPPAPRPANPPPAPAPKPILQQDPSPPPESDDPSPAETPEATQDDEQIGRALVLASTDIYDAAAQNEIRDLVRAQFLLEVGDVVPIRFDADHDTAALNAAGLEHVDPVILVQEVWQPPIRGLLHYLVRMKQEALDQKNLWVLLTRTPGEETLGIEAGDTDFQVWQKTVLALEQPDIQVERIRP